MASRFAVACFATVLVAGCMPRVSVKPNPGPNTPGIRYYRPKPYLLITPFAETTTTTTPVQPPGDAATKVEKKVTGLADRYVQIELKMLPDFSEEYAINIRTGFGSNNTQITLQDGWNLTSLNADLDSQTDENITAVADLVSAIGSVAKGRSFGPDGGGDATEKFVVCATNVPLGFYESVIGRDACGRKQLYGWRYIGFAPFNGCPMQMGGSAALPCDAIELYGLAFENGIMTFKRIHTLEAVDQTGNYLIKESVKCELPPVQARIEALPPGI